VNREEYERLKAQPGSHLTKKEYENLKKTQSTNPDEKFTLSTGDGKTFGAISSGAYRAISNNLLDYYNPVDDNEKKVLDTYKKWVGYGKTYDIVKSQYDKNKYGKGNIDLTTRPIYKNADGSISTVSSMSINEDGKEVLIPTIIKDKSGKATMLTEEEAIEHYRKTGEYLGKFNTVDEANEYANSLHIDQDLYYSNPDYGRDIRDANFWDITINSVKKGYTQSLYGQETYKAMTGQANNKAFYEEKLKSEDYSFIPNGKVEEWVSGAMELLGQQFKQWTDPRSLTAATAGAGSLAATAAIAGQAGPQIAVPEEIATVPAAAITGFITGIQAGSTMANFEIEAGHAYNEMIENGISHETARNIALGVGAGNAALEMIQLDELVKGFKAIKHLNNADSFLKKLGTYLAKKGVSVAKETLQEVGQEGVTMTGVNIAGHVEDKGTIIDWKDFGKRLGDTAVSSAMSFAILGTGGDAVNYTVDKTAKGVNAVKNAITNRKNDKGVTATATSVQTNDVTPDDAAVQTDGAPASPVQTVVDNNAPVQNATDINKTVDDATVEAPTVVQETQQETAERVNQEAEEAVAEAENVVENTPDVEAVSEPTAVSVGDVFKDTKYGNIITVVERDDENTTIEINTGKGTEQRVLKNEQADTLIASEQYAPVNQAETPAAENETDNSAMPTSEVDNGPKVSVGDVYTAEGKTYTITGRGSTYTSYTVTDENGNVVKRRTDNITADVNFTKPDVYTKVHSGAVTDVNPGGVSSTPQNASVADADVATEADSSEAFIQGEDGKFRFNQADIDYTNTTMRKGQFRIRGTDASMQTVSGHIVGKYGIYKAEGAKKYSVYLLQSGLEVGQFKTLAEAKKAATYLDTNLPFNEVIYNRSENGEPSIAHTNELKAYLDDVRQILNDKPYVEAPATEIAENATVDTENDIKNTESAPEDAEIADALADEESFGAETASGEDTEKRYSLSSMGASFFGNESITADEFQGMLEDGSYREHSGYQDYVAKIVDVYKQSRGLETVPNKDVAEIERQIEGLINVGIASKKAGYDILDDGKERNIRDSKERLLFSSLEPNSDYFTSSDISTICDKTKNFTDIYEAIIRREDELKVPEDKRFFNNVDNFFILHKIMADKGLTVPCEECYVQSMRRNLFPMAKAFIELVTEEDANNTANKQLYNDKGKLKPNNADVRNSVRELCSQSDSLIKLEDITIPMLTTADGIARLKLQAPLLYETFNSFYGQAKPKMPREATPFRPGELIALLTNHNGTINTGLVNTIKSTGGFRLQSYSDFQIQNFVDVLQTIFEAGMLGLNGHAYTKVPAFLAATEGTNLKRNLSIFMYDDNGTWEIDKKNSFPLELEDVYALVASDESGNTGIIAVSQNDDMSAWVMANENIGYAIPWHASGVKLEVVRGRVVKTPDGREVLGYANQQDHTKQQSEVWKTTVGKNKENTRVSNAINIYEFWDFEDKKNLPKYKALSKALHEGKISETEYRQKIGLLENALIKKNLKAYIDRCNENNYRPKFRSYLMNNEQFLNKVLQNAKQMGAVPLGATVDDISFKYGEYTIPYGYYKFLGDFGMFKPDGSPSPVDVLSLDNYDFDKAVKFFNDAEKLRMNELLQQFENGTIRNKYRRMVESGGLTTEQLESILREKRSEIARNVISSADSGKRYSAAEPAPAFYSHMANVVDEMKQDKIGASSVVPYLKGRGVKDEEIKWSGIETFLDGKKSVTKAELQEFAAGSMLQIETKELSGSGVLNYTNAELDSLREIANVIEEKWEKIDSLWMEKYGEEIPWDIRFNDNAVDVLAREINKRQRLDGDNFEFFNKIDAALGRIRVLEHNRDAVIRRARERTLAEEGNTETRYSQYTLGGGSNYRELLFKLPGSEYINPAMETHWGEDGVLAHARVQDFEVDGEKMLFIEEIQSDWHNAGQKHGYRQKGQKTEREVRLEEAKAYDDFLNSHIILRISDKLREAGYNNIATIAANLWEGNIPTTLDFLERHGISLTNDEKDYIEEEVYKSNERNRNLKNAASDNSSPDAPFRDTYHEYVLKNLIRMAAEQGYDSIGWTTADIQSKRWSSQYAEGYRIEYDQDIPRFLNKYGKKWGAKVGTAFLDSDSQNEVTYEIAPEEGVRGDGQTYTTEDEAVAALVKAINDSWGSYFSADEVVLYPGEDSIMVADPETGELIGTINIMDNGTKVWSMDITDAMRDSVLYEGQALYSLEGEDKNNERIRKSLLPGDSGRGRDASAQKQTERVSRFERENQGRTRAERQSFAKELLESGRTEEVIDGGDKYILVNPEAYNDDMLFMVEDAASRGLELGFFVGNAKIAFDTKDEFAVDGIRISDSKVLVQYDGIRPPQWLYKHEHVHAKWKTAEMQAVKEAILGDLSERDKKKILSQHRYRRYLSIYRGNVDAVMEEFVADVLSGMNSYTAKYINTVADYWYGNESVDRYSPAEYTEDTDAGGEDTDNANAEDVDLATEEERLGFKFRIRRIKMKVFPPFNESNFSDSHERAERWAHDESVNVGTRKLASHRDRWYIIEKFAALDYGYQIVGAVRTKEVDKFIAEVKRRENESNKARERAFAGLAGNAETGHSNGLRGRSHDRDTDKHIGKAGGPEELATDQSRGKHVLSDTERTAEQNSSDKQDVKRYSFADNGVPDLFEAWDASEESDNDTPAPKSAANTGVKSDRYMASQTSAKENRWVADDATTTPEADEIPTVSELVNDIKKSFGITVKTGKVTARGASGIYKVLPEVIRTKGSNQLPTIIHELGHHLNKRYAIENSQYIDEAKQLVDPDFLAQYAQEDVPGEIAAEFIRRYFKNPEAVARQCPNLTKDFLNSLSKQDAESVNRIAPRVHAYLSAESGDRYGATIVDSKTAKRMDKEDLSDQAHEIYTKWLDGFHPIKQLVDFVEESTGRVAVGAKNAFKLATNSLNAHNISNFVLLEKFRDLNGNIISGHKSFVECVKGINLTNKKTQKDFSEYLKLKHALEVQEKGKKVFADETLGDINNINARLNKLEQMHPEFEKAAQNLYDFQHNILTEFAVKSGLMTQEQADFLRKEYPCYVPFYRYIKGKKGSFARRSLANQKSPVMRMKGSGLDTLDPLENIVQNTERIISASIRHQTADLIGEYADTVEGIGAFIERVPPDQVAKTVDITGLKNKFADELQNVVHNAKDYFAISDLLDEVFGDVVTGFSPVVNERERIIAVQRGDEKAYYQVHNEALFEAITELSPKQASGLLNLLASSMGKLNALITQFNPMFSVANPIRDIKTAYDLGEIDNPAKFIKNYAQAIKLILTSSASYTQFKAMGGGHSSRLNAELGGISNSVKDLQMQDAGRARRLVYSLTRHPIQLLTAFADFTESIPRFMTFLNTYEKTGDLQEAIYQADDITTNFKRRGSGATAKVINSTFRFNNAALQGLDKTKRTFTDADSKRKVQITAKWLTEAILLAVLLNFINRGKDEEGYENLSSYKKNNFYNIALGDGQFLSLPKERENAVLNSLVERTIDALCGEDDAFYDFGGYLASQLLPPMIPGTINPVDAVHELANSTLLGPLTDIGFNKDFKGAPIESNYEKEYMVSSERYGEGTSKLAYELGQTKFAVNADMSPKKIDHLLSAFGFLSSANKALFPMNNSRRDVTVGLRNRFITDSNYSTDVINKVYDNRDLAERDFKYYLSAGEATADKAVEYEQTAVVSDYISGMNKAIKALPADEQRKGRGFLLQALNRWDYSNSRSQADMLSRLGGVTLSDDDCIITDVPDSVLKWTATKKDSRGKTVKGADGKAVKIKYTYTMTPQEYHAYVTDYLNLVDNYRLYQGKQASGQEEYLTALAATKTEVNKVLSKKYQEKYLSKATKTEQ